MFNKIELFSNIYFYQVFKHLMHTLRVSGRWPVRKKTDFDQYCGENVTSGAQREALVEGEAKMFFKIF